MSLTDPQAMLREDVEVIESKRRLLEQIIAITRGIEQIQEGLNAVLVLGMPSREIPQDVLNFHTALSQNLRNLPVNKLQDYLKNLEALIRGQLTRILRYSDIDFSSDEAIEILCLCEGEQTENPLALLEDFKRTAQTSVSLKVLLRKRGITTAAVALPVPKAEIGRQLHHLREQEQGQRSRIRSTVESMRDDLERMIANPTYPEEMKNLLSEVRQKLEKDIEQLQAGAPLSCLSFITDAQELTGLQDQPEVTAETEIEIPPVTAAREMSFTQAANRWLHSPWDVTWREIKGGVSG